MRTPRHMALGSATLLALLAAGCGGDDDNGDGDGDGANQPDSGQVADARPTADGGGASGWEVVEELYRDDTVITERVKYRSDGLLVDGQVCRPVADGVYPVIIYNHGGFEGLGVPSSSGNCVDLARMGYVWVGASYRGEDDSEGEIEVCHGEVTDVLNMIDIALAQPYTDDSRVAMWGPSHGGCITTRAFQRGAPVHVAVDVFGPTDWTANYQFWVDGIANESPYSVAYQQLIEILDTATGGSPAEVPDQYDARSPLHFADDTPSDIPFMVTQGVVDPLVPPGQSCALADAIGLTSYHLDAGLNVVTTAPAGCEDTDLTFTAGARPTPTWPGGRYFVVYDTADHSFAGSAGEAMLADVVTFLFAHLPE